MTLRGEKMLVSITLAAILGPLFFRVSAVTAVRAIPPPAWLTTSLDHILPAAPAAVWPYLSWYPAAFTVLAARRDMFRRAAASYMVAFIACTIGYLLVPVTIDRPLIDPRAGMSAAALKMLYSVDPPVNVFPSFHAAVASTLWRLRPTSPWASAAVSAWVIAVCVACVLTKQHYVLDVIVGMIVGGVALAGVDAVRRWMSSWTRAVGYSTCCIPSGPKRWNDFRERADPLHGRTGPDLRDCH